MGRVLGSRRQQETIKRKRNAKHRWIGYRMEDFPTAVHHGLMESWASLSWVFENLLC
jgi:hypothetical protein